METPMLGKLMGAYFHQDWVDDGDEESTVRLFLQEQPGSTAVAGDIDAVLAAMPTDDEIGRYLLDLGACYVPGPDEGGYRDWLISIAERAREYERGGTAS